MSPSGLSVSTVGVSLKHKDEKAKGYSLHHGYAAPPPSRMEVRCTIRLRKEIHCNRSPKSPGTPPPSHCHARRVRKAQTKRAIHLHRIALSIIYNIYMHFSLRSPRRHSFLVNPSVSYADSSPFRGAENQKNFSYFNSNV